MAKAPTVYDVADHAGVSIATVSRVLRRPDEVRPETRARVLESVRDLGYVPSGSARGLAGRRTGVLGLFLPGYDGIDVSVADTVDGPSGVPLIDDREPMAAPPSTSLYFDEVLRGAEVEAWRHGFALMVAAGRGQSRDVMVNDIAGRVDGLAVLSQTVPSDLVAHVSRRIPVVVVADTNPGDDLDHVGVDNAGGMRALAHHLVDGHGVTSVVYVAGPSDSPDEAGRREGLDQGLADGAFDPAGLRVVPGTFGRERGRAVAEQLLAESALPSAIVCANDQSALGVLDVLAARGVDVPGRVLVTGFDGIDAGRFSTPRLTTVRQPMAELGRVAVRAIVDRLADSTLPARRLTLPVQILLRESCPPAP
ncbi:LacI family transcriptional regulator [Frondihabitans sp. PhB188]|uniref:LacI family DNA-binding transcriptional regulator n=1 Tax=Frondihabitans sp. PhB188 TaxID=2485200 RepID=UPI000F47B7B3|nr:LacI family DNA-binding transcriptional regulator [Frondihabitans sp. PhB188]ROQ39975.1 LacI family transcriptional regulator [Frondihabitans sp. PhB188]